MQLVDLFTGTGGFSLAANALGIPTVAMCENEDYIESSVLRKHWPDVNVFKDIKTLSHGAFGDCSEAVFTGGFPCQDISISGKNKGIINGERSALWFEYKRVIKENKPKYVIIENVFTLLSRGLNIILEDLAEVGYDATWTMFDSQWFGVPQRRRRVYILAVRDGIPEGADIFRFNERSSERIKPQMEVIKKSRIRAVEESRERGEGFAFFTKQRSDEYAELGVGSTLTKRDYKDFTDIIYQNGFLRRITPTERLLLQGYPKDFFEGLSLSRQQAFMLNGMTIPVVKYLFECLLEFDNGNP